MKTKGCTYETEEVHGGDIMFCYMIPIDHNVLKMVYLGVFYNLNQFNLV